MADYAIHDTTLEEIADTIRKKDGTQALIDPADYADRINLMGMLEEKTASGAIASFEDGADDVPISSGLFSFTPKQAGTGTPSPSNPRAISGYTGATIYHTGKNLFDKAHPNVVSGYIDTVSFNTGNQNAKTIYIPIKGGETYTVSKTAGIRFAIATSENIPSSGETYTSRKANNTASSLYITAGATDAYLWAWVFMDGSDTGTLDDMLASVQIEFGSTHTQYENFVGIETIVDTFGATVYGGSRATDGTLTDEYGFIEFTGASSEAWSYGANAQNKGRVWIKINDAKPSGISMCNYLAQDTVKPAYPDEYNSWINSSSQIIIGVPSSITSASDWKTYLSNNTLQVSYELATPTPTTLSVVNINTYYGANNIYTDMETGNSKVTYRSSGTVTPIVPTLISKSITENGTYNASSDNVDGYSSVTVNVPTAPSGMVVMDFTSISSPFTLNGVSYGSTGAVFDNTSDYIDLPFFHAGMEIEIDVASISLGQNANWRFFSSYRNQGFLYRNSNVWSFYNGSWYDTNISDSGYFDNSTVKIVVDSNNYWHIYKDDVLIFEPAGACAISEPAIGSKEGSCINNATITGVRMKEATS